MFQLAVHFVKGHLKAIDWWPSLLKNVAKEDYVESWPMTSFGWLVAQFLREISPVDEHQWLAYGSVLLHHYCYDYKDKQLLIQAMVYLLASQPDVLEEVKTWMQAHGHNPGEFRKF